ncbi:MAG TPA: endonuclease/exonuclease/phosphatase family protein [Nocardioidaceae bacterium]|jgi:endonuclease/exonuclease/phosphatase family metal-dependent hydrolase|nr:endonuclease/exonuclease/phosphatase family protein [Nocardioidaceae bacterium]
MLRVATYNLYLGADLTLVFDARGPDDLERRTHQVLDQLEATDFRERAGALAGVLMAARLDVIGLQEVARWSHAAAEGTWRVRWDFLELLLEALAERGCCYDAVAVQPTFGGALELAGGRRVAVRGHDVLLVRREGPVTVQQVRRGTYARALRVVTPMPGLVLEVTRGWCWADVTLHGPMRVATTHTEAWNREIRDAQRDELLGLLEPDAAAGRPTVVLGDLNAPPDEVGVPAPYRDAWAVAGGPSPGWTCAQAADLGNSASALDRRVDYVWVRGLDVAGAGTLGDRPDERTARGLWPSDHAGVFAALVPPVA